MRKITLKQLELVNFKGVRNQIIPFTENTEISGANGSGKTTINDAFLWLLFGKNSEDKTDFNVKTLDQYNVVIPKIDHEVNGTFDVDGETVVLKRVLKENWKTKKGNEIEEFSGNQTTYFVDGVPKSQTEFKSAVSNIIDEKISKLISSPTFFNSNVSAWGWKNRREILELMAGTISDNELLGSETDYSLIIDFLTTNKNLENEKKRISAERLKAKHELDTIQPRIDEAQRNKPEDSDWLKIEDGIDDLKSEITSIDEQIFDKNKSVDAERERIGKIKTDKYNKEQELVTLTRDNDVKANEEDPELIKQGGIKRNALRLINESIADNGDEVEELKSDSSRLEEGNTILKVNWKTINESTFVIDENATDCPTCKRALDNAEAKQEELRANFNSDKVEKLSEISKKGKANADTITKNGNRILKLEENIQGLQTNKPIVEAEMNDLLRKCKSGTAVPVPTPAMIKLKAEIEAIVVPEVVVPNVAELNEKKEIATIALDGLKTSLQDKGKIKTIEIRVAELGDQQRTLSQTIADCQKVEMQIDKFNKSKASLIEERVNSKFQLAKFKMFENQINGGETPTCICTVGGVPFNDLNTAMQINVGLDIINAMQKHFEVLAPVFVDHKESVTKLHLMDCQMISLKVDDTVEGIQVFNA